MNKQNLYIQIRNMFNILDNLRINKGNHNSVPNQVRVAQGRQLR